jgi:outer membrane protein OmpA-like peptidoglycan-associated protein
MLARKTAVRGLILAGCGLAGLTLAACDNGGTGINPKEAAKTETSDAVLAAAPAKVRAASPAPVVDPSQVVTAHTPTRPLPHYDIHFGSGSADLMPEATSILSTVVAYLHKYPTVQVKLSGYTDRTGSLAFNQLLAERRAKRVASFLEKNGIDQSRIETVSMGEGSKDNVPAGENPGHWNRRVSVDFTLAPNS